MTKERDHEIYQAADDYKYNPTTGSVMGFRDCCFVDGAKWADANPSEETIKKVSKLMFDAINNNSLEDGQLTMIQYIQKHWNEINL